jgi:hypothetical protein
MKTGPRKMHLFQDWKVLPVQNMAIVEKSY